jgi:hypothetical protein
MLWHRRWKSRSDPEVPQLYRFILLLLHLKDGPTTAQYAFVAWCC